MTNVQMQLKGETAIRIRLPRYMKHKYRFLKSIVGSQCPVNKIEFDDNGFPTAFSVAFVHYDTLLSAFTELFDETQVWSEHSKSTTCTSACQTALYEDCDCSCLGVGHKGGKGLLGAVEPMVLDRGQDKVAYRVYPKGFFTK